MTTETKNFGKADEQREFGHGRIYEMQVGGHNVGRSEFEPGWRWSNDVKPIAKTDKCMFEHFLYVQSGNMHVEGGDGTELDIGPNDVVHIDPGHDAWITGNESCVVIDFMGKPGYARA